MNLFFNSVLFFTLSLTVPFSFAAPGSVHLEQESVNRALQMNTGEIKYITKDELWKALVLFAEQPELFEGGLPSRVVDIDSKGALIRTAQYEGKTFRERITFDPKQYVVVFANMDTGQSVSRSVMTDDTNNLYVSFSYNPSSTTKKDLSWNQLQDTHNNAIIDFFNTVSRLQREGYLTSAHETKNISRGTYQITPSTFKFTSKLKAVDKKMVEGSFKKIYGTLIFPEDLNQTSISITADTHTVDTVNSGLGVIVRKLPKIDFKNQKVVALSESFNFFGTIVLQGKVEPVTLSLEYKGLVQSPRAKDRLVFKGNVFVRKEVIGVTFEATPTVHEYVGK